MRRVRKHELNGIAELWHFSLDDSELAEFHALTEWLANTV
jgi:hypothetical protein